MNIFSGRADILAAAIHSESHPQVRRILDLNAWKIKSWKDYASWKRHARWFVPQTYKTKLGLIASRKEVIEA